MEAILRVYLELLVIFLIRNVPSQEVHYISINKSLFKEKELVVEVNCFRNNVHMVLASYS
jgi:hypothetical protein